MFRKRLRSIFSFVFLLFCLSGCSIVSSKSTVGTPVQEDLSGQFDGVWEGDSGICYIKYSGEGRLQIANVEWQDDKFRLKIMEGILTQCGDRKFVNFPDPETSGENRTDYIFAYYSFVGDNLLAVWMPKINVFEKAVSDGEIRGKVIEGKYSTSVQIDESEESLCRFIQSRNTEELFDLEEPLVYRRIKKLEQSEEEENPTGHSSHSLAPRRDVKK